VFLRDQFLKRGGAEADLITNGGLKPWGPDERGLGFVGLCLGIGFVGKVEEHGWIALGPLGMVPMVTL
jgi:hypothetical protein